MTKYLSIDRIEGLVAICIDDDGKKHVIKIEKLPQNAHETDVLYLHNDEFLISKKETNLRRKRTKKLEKSLNIT
jgi:hypothetical protein